LDRSLVRGIVWTSAVKWGSQGLAWVATLVVARKLGPDAYGLVRMAMVYMGLISMMSEAGIGTALITLRHLDEERIAQVNGATAILGVAAMLFSVFASFFVERIFDTAHLRAIVLVLSPTLIMASLQTVPQALLQRDMRFKLLAAIEGLQAFIASSSTVVFALVGFGFWALIVGQILGAIAYTLALLLSVRQAFARPRIQDVREPLTFGSHVITTRFAWYVYSNADFAIVGRVLGKTALGAYSFGATLASIPVEKITSLVVRVTPSILSAAQDDRAALRRYVLLVTEAVAMLTVPATVGLALVARPFVLAALGDHWQSTVGPLRLLAAYAAVRSVSPLITQVLTALGDTRFVMRANIAAAGALLVAFVVAAHWGITAVAATWIVVHPLVALVPIYSRAFRAIDLSGFRYLRSLLPALAGSALMALVVLAMENVLPSAMRPVTRLLVLVAAGAVSYGLVMVATQRERLVKIRAAITQLQSA
jgi:PST family polysaccharide transporter